jgi:DNA-binding NtrC family response regulator
MSRVLLVEGGSDEHSRLAGKLRADGHQVVEVSGREELQALLIQLHRPSSPGELPDLIIADAEESIDLLLEAHALQGGTPVILLAQAGDIDLIREAEALEAAYVFYSPAEVDELRRATHRLG